jgi:hypothetical protein
MKHVALFIICALSWTLSWTQELPSEVTDEQIAFYQRGIETGCKDSGQRHGDPAEKVSAFCECVIKVLKTSLTRAEWQQAFFSSFRRDPLGEQRVMAPHMQKIGVCRSAP